MKRPLRYYYLKLVRQTGTPDNIAGGMALGIFISLTVPPFVQMVTAIILAFLLGLNRITAIIGCMFTNPLTWPFILAAQFFAGMLITGTPMPEHVPGTYEDVWLYLTNFRASWPLIKAFLVGAVATGVVAAIIGYYLTRVAVTTFRNRRQRQLRKRYPETASDGSSVFPPDGP